MTADTRQSTGIAELDAALGGGLLPGTLTVLAGATGIGKTQFGLSYLSAGERQEGRRGIVFDMSSRGDSQNHANYASGRYGWTLQSMPAETPPPAERVWNADGLLGDYLQTHSRKLRPTGDPCRDLDFDQWLDWKAELAKLTPEAHLSSSTATLSKACGVRWSMAWSPSIGQSQPVLATRAV